MICSIKNMMMMMMVVVETMMVMMVVVVETMMVMVVGATIWKVGGESRQKRVSSCLRSSSPSFAHYCHTATLPHCHTATLPHCHTATLQLALLLLLNALHSNYQPPSWQNQPAAAAEILMLIIIIIAIAIIIIVIVITNVK